MNLLPRLKNIFLIRKIECYNEQFGIQLQKLVTRSEEIKEDLKEFLVDCISTMDKKISRQSIKDTQVEVLIQRYYDPQKLQNWFDTCRVNMEEGLLYPSDAATSVKLLTTGIKDCRKNSNRFTAIIMAN